MKCRPLQQKLKFIGSGPRFLVKGFVQGSVEQNIKIVTPTPTLGKKRRKNPTDSIKNLTLY